MRLRLHNGAFLRCECVAYEEFVVARQGMTLLCMTRPVTDITVETQSDWGYSLGVADWKGPSGHIGGAFLGWLFFFFLVSSYGLNVPFQFCVELCLLRAVWSPA